LSTEWWRARHMRPWVHFLVRMTNVGGWLHSFDKHNTKIMLMYPSWNNQL
jgi:hypothetical protein